MLTDSDNEFGRYDFRQVTDSVSLNFLVMDMVLGRPSVPCGLREDLKRNSA